MSNLIHCDGPSCDKTRDPRIRERSYAESGWLHTETEDFGSLDFCSHKCMGDWARAQPGSTTAEVDGR